MMAGGVDNQNRCTGLCAGLSQEEFTALLLSSLMSSTSTPTEGEEKF
jgi:hypothetical protein